MSAGMRQAAGAGDGRDETFGGVLENAPAPERRVRIPLTTLDRIAARLAEDRARFVDLFVFERPERCLAAVLAHRGALVALLAPLSSERAAYGSLSLAIPGARWPERELHDLHGLRPLAHPDLRTLVAPDVDAFATRVAGEEVFTIPYGPVRSGVFESIQFLIETAGEDVLRIDVRPGFKRRGLERRFAGLDPTRATFVAERIAGISSVAHATAFAQAVERALAVDPPRRAQLWRAVLAELERIANHLDVAARLAEDCALTVGNARFAIHKEDVLRLQAELTGSRFARGLVVPGGLRHEPRLAPGVLAAWLDRFEREFRRDRRLLVRTTSFTDRLIGSGRLDRATTAAFGGVGPVARATGLATDSRFERPYGAYPRLGFEVVTRDEGDAMARFDVRMGEIGQSLHLLRQALDGLGRHDGELCAALPVAVGSAFGWSEAAQGEVVYRVAVADGLVEEVHVSSPSRRNWALFAESFRGDVLTDFAFIEHSFGLTAAGADR
jgi:formate hydrogenlyase subunit 5